MLLNSSAYLKLSEYFKRSLVFSALSIGLFFYSALGYGAEIEKKYSPTTFSEKAIGGTGRSTKAIGGTGRSTKAIGGTGRSTKAIGGTGRSTKAIGGTGRSTKAIGGTGRSTKAIGGTGRSTKAIGGTGRSTKAIGGTGRSTKAIGGTGRSTKAIGGTGRSAKAGLSEADSTLTNLDLPLVRGRVDAWDPVASVIHVLGQNIVVADIPQLALGTTVVVEGLIAKDGTINAEFIWVDEDSHYVDGASEVVITGLISSVDSLHGKLSIGDLVVDYTAALSGEFVTPSVGSILRARGIRPSPDGEFIALEALAN